MIELRQFRQFIAVAEELNFRRAAERLHMAQPPLTAAVRKIERELGTSLIDRTNRVTRLTDAGRAFLDEARRTLAQADRAISVATRAGAGLTGSLRITFVPSAAHDLLPQILRAFRAKHLDVELDLTEATTAHQAAALMEGRADIGLVMPPLHNAKGLAIRMLRRNQLIIALPDGHPLAQNRAIRLIELAREQWVLFPARQGPGLYGRILTACAHAGFIPHAAQEALQMDTIASLVAGGMGVALVPASFALMGRRGVVFRRPTGPGTPIAYELGLAYRDPSAAINAFGDIAHAVACASADSICSTETVRMPENTII
jgi:DNA-binding transcriptional LysR family regulator